MSRVSIEVTDQQHKQLKAAAALAGKSIKEYVLGKILPFNADENLAIRELEDFLEPRVKQAGSGKLSNKSVTQIAQETYKQFGI